jgi:four helix bundle protein
MRIARREAKESHHWLELLLTANPSVEDRVKLLINEADELKRILSSIIEKSR